MLHTLGATPRLLARALLAEQTFLAGIGVGVGLLLGAAVGATMAPLVILTPAAGRPVPRAGVRAALGADRPDRGRPAAGGAGLQRVHRRRHPSAGGRGAAANRGRTMSVGAAARRVRAYGGQFLLLAVLTLVVTLLVSGVPRLVNRLAEQGLREHLDQRAARPPGPFVHARPPRSPPPDGRMADAQERFDALAAAMPPQVRVGDHRAVVPAWTSRRAGWSARTWRPRNLLVDLGLRAMPGVQGAGTLVEGRWPHETRLPDQPIEVALDADVARKLNLRAGSRLRSAPSISRVPSATPACWWCRPVPARRPRGRRSGTGCRRCCGSSNRRATATRSSPPAWSPSATLDKRAAEGWPVQSSGATGSAWTGSTPRGLEPADRRPAARRSGPSRPAPRLTQAVDVPLRAFAAR